MSTLEHRPDRPVDRRRTGRAAALAAVFVAVALRVLTFGDGGEDNQTRAQSSPTSTPLSGLLHHRVRWVQVVGSAPACTSLATAQMIPNIARVGEPVKMTMHGHVVCPQLRDRRRVVVVAAGLPPGTRGDEARRGFRRIVDFLARGADNRIAIVDVAAPDAQLVWADEPAAFRLLADRAAAWPSRPADPSDAWLRAIATARAALSTPDAQRQLLFVVLGAEEPTSDADAVRTAIADLGQMSRERAGQTMLVDLTPTGRLFVPLMDDGAPDARFMTVFASTNPDRTIDDVLTQAMALFDAPIRELGASHFGPELAGVTCAAPVFDPPFERVLPTRSYLDFREATGYWSRRVDGYSASITYTIELRLERPMRRRGAFGSLLILRDGMPGWETLDDWSIGLCVAAAEPVPRECPTQAPAAATATPQLPCPPLNGVWLPVGGRP